MAPPPLVTAPELESWLATTFTAAQTERAEAVLSAVSALVRSEVGLTWVEADGVTLSDDVPAEVTAVTLQVATRVYLNPAGLRQEAATDYSASYGQDSGLYLKPEERALLSRYRTNARGLWSLSMTREDPYADSAWVPVAGTTALFPWYGDDVIVP